jgi:hypothetical protein
MQEKWADRPEALWTSGCAGPADLPPGRLPGQAFLKAGEGYPAGLERR